MLLQTWKIQKLRSIITIHKRGKCCNLFPFFTHFILYLRCFKHNEKKKGLTNSKALFTGERPSPNVYCWMAFFAHLVKIHIHTTKFLACVSYFLCIQAHRLVREPPYFRYNLVPIYQLV